MEKMSPSGGRLLYLDACRAAFMLLGILLHASLPFSAVRWDINAAHNSAALDYLYYLITSFRMPGFFIIAGYFAALGVTRHGTSPWLTSRVNRLGIPLVLAMLFLVPLQSIAVAMPDHASITEVLRAAKTRHFQFGFHLVSHLWFLLDLLIMCASFALLNKVSPILLPQLTRNGYAAVLPKGILAHAAALFLLAAYLVLVHWLSRQHIGQYLVLGGDPLWAVLDVWRLLYYAPFFALGVLLARERRLLDWFVHPSRLTTIWAFLCLAGFVWVGVHGPETKYSYYAKVAIAAPCGLLLPRLCMQLAKYLIDGSNRFVSAAANSSYTIYVVHHPIVMFMSILAIYLDYSALQAFALVVVTTTALSVAIYVIARRLLPRNTRSQRAALAMGV